MATLLGYDTGLQRYQRYIGHVYIRGPGTAASNNSRPLLFTAAVWMGPLLPGQLAALGRGWLGA